MDETKTQSELMHQTNIDKRYITLHAALCTYIYTKKEEENGENDKKGEREERKIHTGDERNRGKLTRKSRIFSTYVQEHLQRFGLHVNVIRKCVSLTCYRKRMRLD